MNELDDIVNKLYNQIIKIIPNSKKMLRDYWEIGKMLSRLDEMKIKQSYQTAMLTELSIKLNNQYTKGYGLSTLEAMKNFYNDFFDFNKVNSDFNWSYYSKSRTFVNRKGFERIRKNRISEQPLEILIKLFLKVNQKFLQNEMGSILLNLSERSLCARMMLYFQEAIAKTTFNDYYVDVEYNRNDGKVKTIIEKNEELVVVSVTCDLIIHSRGEKINQDNLLALEMKKSTASEQEKKKDKNRLIALTKDSYDDVWSFDGRTLPEHVCRYLIGIYYEIDIANRLVVLEYYRKGKILDSFTMNF
ncbi:DUF1016 N-terminal domain-containing protein [Anaerosinus massiliensis]|uniref:DUF1016 N-terminal domain-containing protein n=1 Tax=Massilibacillus massiliensis TaxID=1806837 RepID=UPI0018FEC209|nr:DUF1016 N-terminal domain-containing protein [Massilibacillus massiliensis]